MNQKTMYLKSPLRWSAWVALFVGGVFLAQQGLGESLRRPVHTYSIVARDAATGEMGVAVQSHWFSVGTIVSWAEAGVGVVATQSFVEPSYGPLGLELMSAGKSAEQALGSLLATDPQPQVRQIAMVDARGNVAVHTGESCIKHAGHVLGEGFAVQANMMEKSTVWQAMAKAFEAADGDLAERLLVALEAAQTEGGDLRGMQSASLVVVSPESTGKSWVDRKVDLRIEDHPQPIAEMRRLLGVQRAYAFMNKGDELMADGEIEGAVAAYSTAAELQPDNLEVVYWKAITLASVDRLDEALPLFRRVFDAAPKWRELTARLPAAGLLPDDADLLRAILGETP